MNSLTNTLWSSGTLGGRLLPAKERILFGSVHEDAEIERAALRVRREKMPSSQTLRAFCIASGGCTAFSLLLEPDVEVVAVDVNPAQIYLCELKQAVFAQVDAATALGDARSWFLQVENELSPSGRTFWHANQGLLRSGLNGCGFVERVMRVTSRLWDFWLGKRNIDALMKGDFEPLRDPRWHWAFRIALNRLVLRMFYARGYLSSLPPGFARQIRRRIENSLTHFPIAENPYIQQTLHGHYNSDEHSSPTYWQHHHRDLLRSQLKHIQFKIADAAAFLEAQLPHSFDFFALSNLLEVCRPAEQARLLRAVAHTATPEALVCVRAILTRQAPRRWPTPFQVEESLTQSLQELDRSPLCPLWRVLKLP